MAFALVAMGISCSKPSQKRIAGKWQLVSDKDWSSNYPTWDEYIDADDYIVAEFRSDGTCIIFYNGEQDDVVTWAYDKSTEKIYFGGDSFDLDSFSSKEMVWKLKETDGDWSYEEILTWKRSNRLLHANHQLAKRLPGFPEAFVICRGTISVEDNLGAWRGHLEPLSFWPAWPRKMRVGANSPSLWPTMFSVT